MKALALLLLFCAAAHGANTTTTNAVGDITTRTFKRTGEEGVPLRRLETVYRGKVEILQTSNSHYKKENRTLIGHCYYIGGNLAVAEDFEKGAVIGLTVHFPGTDDFETFMFQPDGSVKPASNKAIELAKEESKVYGEYAEKMFQPDASNHIDSLYNEERKKIGDLGKQEMQATNVPGEITTKVDERNDKKGKPDLRVETSYRGANRILRVVSRPNKKHKMAIWSRTYCVEGKSIATESDDDGDGFFETLMLQFPNSNDLEIFQRNRDGTVIPRSTAEIESVKKASALALKPLAKGIQNPNMSDAEIDKALEEARQNVQQFNKTNAIH